MQVNYYAKRFMSAVMVIVLYLDVISTAHKNLRATITAVVANPDVKRHIAQNARSRSVSITFDICRRLIPTSRSTVDGGHIVSWSGNFRGNNLACLVIVTTIYEYAFELYINLSVYLLGVVKVDSDRDIDRHVSSSSIALDTYT